MAGNTAKAEGKPRSKACFTACSACRSDAYQSLVARLRRKAPAFEKRVKRAWAGQPRTNQVFTSATPGRWWNSVVTWLGTSRSSFQARPSNMYERVRNRTQPRPPGGRAARRGPGGGAGPGGGPGGGGRGAG